MSVEMELVPDMEGTEQYDKERIIYISIVTGMYCKLEIFVVK